MTEIKINEIAENTALMARETLIDNIAWQTADISLIGDKYNELNEEILKRSLKLILKSMQ
jgi:hypothetical protein|tara:strand:- start:256 stop:435 length:180 start_codon:yes stop_codon:yes gene_type:complete